MDVGFIPSRTTLKIFVSYMFDVNVYLHLQSHPHHLSAVDATKMAVAIFCLQQIGAVCGKRVTSVVLHQKLSFYFLYV